MVKLSRYAELVERITQRHAMTVTNVEGSSSEPVCEICGPWIDHWENYTKEPVPESCPVCGSTDNDIVGAHVTVNGDKTVFIMPICSGCNGKHGKTLGALKTSLAPDSIQDTCKKPE